MLQEKKESEMDEEYVPEARFQVVRATGIVVGTDTEKELKTVVEVSDFFNALEGTKRCKQLKRIFQTVLFLQG